MMYHHQSLLCQRRLLGSVRIVGSFSRQHQQKLEATKTGMSMWLSRNNSAPRSAMRTNTTSLLSRASASSARKSSSSRRSLSSKPPSKPAVPRNTKSGENILPLDFVTSPAVQFALPLLGHGAYIILASGFLMTDMLYLRVVLAGGYAGLVVFHTMHPRPLRIPLRWSALFIFVNAGAACFLLADRYAPTFSEDDEELYIEHFKGALTRGQFYQLLQLGTRQDFPDGEVLAVEGRACQNVYFIEHGRAKIYHHKAFAATINEGGFANDVAFQQGPNVGAYGTVVTSGTCSLLVWDQSTLRAHLADRPEMGRNMKYLMSDHLVKSLLRQREAAHDRQQEMWKPDDNVGLQKRHTAELKFGFRRSPSESKIAWDLRHTDDNDVDDDDNS